MIFVALVMLFMPFAEIPVARLNDLRDCRKIIFTFLSRDRSSSGKSHNSVVSVGEGVVDMYGPPFHLIIGDLEGGRSSKNRWTNWAVALSKLSTSLSTPAPMGL
jgi:hypothetical protein